jgi:hypothetical protein
LDYDGKPLAKIHLINFCRKLTVNTLFSILIFVLALHWGVEGTGYSPFLKSYFNLSDLQLSLYVSISLFFLAFSGLAIAFLRFDARLNQKIFLFALSISGSGQILMVNPNIYASLFFRIIHEIGDGFLGLGYFKGKRVTIDYKEKKIGISERLFEHKTICDNFEAVVPLLEASDSHADLIYVLGKVRGHSTVIYLDTGSSASFIDPSMVDAGKIKKGKKHLIAENVHRRFLIHRETAPCPGTKKRRELPIPSDRQTRLRCH